MKNDTEKQITTPQKQNMHPHTYKKQTKNNGETKHSFVKKHAEQDCFCLWPVTSLYLFLKLNKMWQQINKLHFVLSMISAALQFMTI